MEALDDPVFASEERSRGGAQACRNAWLARDGGRAHAWGKIYCPRRHDECRCGEFCITSVLEHAQESGHHARLAARGRSLHRARPTRRAPRNSDGIHLHPEIPAGQRCRGHGRRHRASGRSRLRRRAGGHRLAGPPGAGIHARGAQRRGAVGSALDDAPRLARRPPDRSRAGPGRPDGWPRSPACRGRPCAS